MQAQLDKAQEQYNSQIQEKDNDIALLKQNLMETTQKLKQESLMSSDKVSQLSIQNERLESRLSVNQKTIRLLKERASELEFKLAEKEDLKNLNLNFNVLFLFQYAHSFLHRIHVHRQRIFRLFNQRLILRVRITEN